MVRINNDTNGTFNVAGVADIIFAQNPFSLNHAVACWRRSLRGSWVCQPETLLGKKCICLKYQAAISTRRKLWCSHAFRAQSPDLWLLLQDHCHQPASRWRLLGTPDEFVTARTAAGRRTSMVSGLVLEAEALQPATRIKHVFSNHAFLDFVTHRDTLRGSYA